MGITQAITQKLLETIVKAIVMWIVLVILLGIPFDKTGPILLGSFIATIIGTLTASLLLRGSKGY